MQFPQECVGVSAMENPVTAGVTTNPSLLDMHDITTGKMWDGHLRIQRMQNPEPP
jgi:hypothetical protein